MLQRNTPQKTLESWKQIAAYLDRSQRTARRWESTEGLPVHRRAHQSQDTIFAYQHEIDNWSQLRTQAPAAPPPGRAGNLDEADWSTTGNTYLGEHDAIARALHRYIAGVRAGDAGLMRPSFHPEATISGYCLGVEYNGSIEHVFTWIGENGAAPNIEPRFARIEIIETIAIVHLEVRGWSGKLAGANAGASDVFTLLKRGGEWQITHKLFHWH